MHNRSADLDPDRAGAIVRSQFPELGSDVRWLGEGYDSTAFEVDGRWVFRFPKRSDVEEQLLVESRILPVLAQESPLPVPVFHFHGMPGALFPRHFVGYAMIAGTPAAHIRADATPFRAFAAPVAAFLSWLHGYRPEDAAAHGVPQVSLPELLAAAVEDARSDVLHIEEVAPEEQARVWRRFLESPPSAETELPPRLTHGDLAAEHVIVDNAAHTITGIIDWSEISIGDAAIDLAALFHWGGPAFAAAVLKDYDHPIDHALLHRARYLGACRGAADITFGIETGRPGYVEIGLRALHHCIGTAGRLT